LILRSLLPKDVLAQVEIYDEKWGFERLSLLPLAGWLPTYILPKKGGLSPAGLLIWAWLQVWKIKQNGILEFMTENENKIFEMIEKEKKWKKN
jgi:hypothetical protein